MHKPQREDHAVISQREDHTVISQREDHVINVTESQNENNPVYITEPDTPTAGNVSDNAFSKIKNDIANAKETNALFMRDYRILPEKYLYPKFDDRYVIQEIISFGDKTVSYKAYDNKCDRTVAIKLIKEKYLTNEMSRQKFKNQSKAIAVLSHPNIAKVYDVSLGTKLDYVVSEYIDGISLKHFIKYHQGCLSPKFSAYIAEQILRALRHTHEKGVLHPNLNSRNIMLLSDGSIKITDFGILLSDNKHTVDFRDNIYSVCEILYEMLTGLTFDDPYYIKPFFRLSFDNFDNKDNNNDDDIIPENLKQIIIHGLSQDKNHRYHSVADMLLDILEYNRNPEIEFEYTARSLRSAISSIKNKRTPNKKNSKNKKRKALKVVLAILGVLTAVFIFWILFGHEIQTAVFGYKHKADIYNEAVSYAEQGDKANAAIYFGKVGDYKDATEKSFALWDEIAVRETVSAGSHHTAILKNDGTVVTFGLNEQGQCNTEYWADITAVSAGALHTVALKSDGTVLATGNNKDRQCEVDEWTNIVAVSAGDYHTVALKSDSTVLAVGNNSYNQCDISGWKNIISVSAGDNHTVALKSDGTVVATGWNDYKQCEVNGWTNIVAVSAGDYNTVGLKSDGTVVVAGKNHYSQKDVASWEDIVAISASDYHLIGLKSDGSAVAVGLNDKEQCSVDKWKNSLVAVSAGGFHTIGLTSGGSVVAIGDNTYSQCDAKGLQNIMLPAKKELLISAK